MNPASGTSQTPEPESDLHRALAEARRMMREQDTEYRNPGVTATYPDTEFDMEWAASIVSLPPMQDIARLAAIGAAVERLPRKRRWSVERVPFTEEPRLAGSDDAEWGWCVMRPDGDLFYGPTLTAAIEEALR